MSLVLDLLVFYLSLMNREQIGSMTAIGGFVNEANICDKFLNYQNDNDVQIWLSIMGYDYQNIETLTAVGIPPRISRQTALNLGISEDNLEETARFKKADIQVRLEITVDNALCIENISLKKSNRSAGFNQVDKRPVDTYKRFWDFDEEIARTLKLFTGELLPETILSSTEISTIGDKRRMFLTELPREEVDYMINYFEQNKYLVVSDILRGRGGFSADWFLVTRKNSAEEVDWILKDINFVCNFYCQGEVVISPRGSLKIGRVTMQRKGGTPDPTSLQFKINPLELFD